MVENVNDDSLGAVPWPEIPKRTVLTAKRVDSEGGQRLWAVTKSKSLYRLDSASRSPGEWSSFVSGDPVESIVAAVQSDVNLISLRPNEISWFSYDSRKIRDLRLVWLLRCVGFDAQTTRDWPAEIFAFWSASDAKIEDHYDGYECTSRWAAINDERVSCIQFDDGVHTELIPTLFESYGELDICQEVGSGSFREDDDMGRPFSYSGRMSLRILRPGYAFSLHQMDADVVAGPSYFMRIPLDPEGEGAAIEAWQEDMDEKTFVNYEGD